jgi:hypothetical protein
MTWLFVSTSPEEVSTIPVPAPVASANQTRVPIETTPVLSWTLARVTLVALLATDAGRTGTAARSASVAMTIR